MNRILSTLTILASIIFSSCSGAPKHARSSKAQHPLSKTPEKRPLRPMDVVHAVNRHRASIGKKPMIQNDLLAQQAQNHSLFLLNIYNTTGRISVEHTGFQGRFDTIKETADIYSLAENICLFIGHTIDPAERAVNIWTRSSGHNNNIKGSWTVTGVGVARAADGMYFVTQLYGK